MPKLKYKKARKSAVKVRKKNGVKKPKMGRNWRGRPRYQMIFGNLNDENNLSNPLYRNQENDFQMPTYDRTTKVA